MKISDLTEKKKGPIIGAPKGSQKDARMGTDDPSKYMRGGEWEAYREPQGVSSNAGKIAGGTKKGTTRTKNKKTSESVYSDKKLYKTRWKPEMLPDPKDAPQVAPYASPPRGVDGIDFIIDFGVRDKMKDTAYKGDKRRQAKASISGANPANAKDPRSIKLMKEFDEMDEGIQPHGAGSNNDVVGTREPTTITMVKDKGNKESMPGSKAPVKQAKNTVKRSLTNTPGIKNELNEAVLKPWVRDYNADYELRDDADTETIGVATVTHGVIEVLAVRNDLAEDFNGHILSRLMSTIVNDADLAGANLAIQIDDPEDLQHKRFMERFGFRHTENGIMKRNAGSIRPPSVPSARI